MAFDFTGAGDDPGPNIYISRSSVEEFIGRRRSNAPQMLARALGRVVAHELAHRFLQIREHSDRGILRPWFSRMELTELRPCRFYFTEEQMSFLHSYAPNAGDLRALSQPVDDDGGER